jgi:hypothetical protein
VSLQENYILMAEKKRPQSKNKGHKVKNLAYLVAAMIGGKIKRRKHLPAAKTLPTDTHLPAAMADAKL